MGIYLLNTSIKYRTMQWRHIKHVKYSTLEINLLNVLNIFIKYITMEIYETYYIYLTMDMYLFVKCVKYTY